MPKGMAIGKQIGVPFGMDPMQFGIMLLINCALGLNT
eukprot:gene43256-52871_t